VSEIGRTTTAGRTNTSAIQRSDRNLRTTGPADAHEERDEVDFGDEDVVGTVHVHSAPAIDLYGW
jgi:hypothetical protein